MAPEQPESTIHHTGGAFNRGEEEAKISGPTTMQGAHSQSSGSQQDSQGARLGAPSGLFTRSYLPRLRSLPTSVPSSREGSPRSAVSEAPSIATQAMARLAKYRGTIQTIIRHFFEYKSKNLFSINHASSF